MKKLLLSFFALAGTVAVQAAGPSVQTPLPFFTNFQEKGASEKFTIIDGNPEPGDVNPYTWVIGEVTREEVADPESTTDKLWRDGIDNYGVKSAVYCGFRRSDNWPITFPHTSIRPNRPGDDWLITQALQGIKDVEYTISFLAAANFEQRTGANLEIVAATAPTQEAMEAGQKIASVFDIPDYTAIEEDIEDDGIRDLGKYKFTYKNEFENGALYIGFHSVAAPDIMFWINEIRIDAGASKDAPAEVENLAVEAGQLGARTAKITFKAPVNRLDGTALDNSEITQIAIYRDGEGVAIKTFEAPANGAELEFMDEGIPVGTHTWTVVCYSDRGNNAGTEVKSWVGEDYSAGPRNFKVKRTDDSFVLTWDAPIASLNGGYVDFENLQYVIYAGINAGSISTDPQIVAIVNEREAVISRSMFAYPGQYSITFIVYASSEAGYNMMQSYAMARTTGGEIYRIPFTESFANGKLYSDPWTTVEGTDGQPYKGAWTFSSSNTSKFILSAQDEDNGYAVFQNSFYPTYELRLLSPEFSVGNAVDPVVEFYIGSVEVPENNNNYLQIELVDGLDYIPVGDPCYFSGTGWKKYQVSLKNDEGLTSYRLSFLGSANKGITMLLDNIRAYDTENPNSAVDNVADDASVRVITEDGGILIFGACDYSVYSVNGMEIASGVSESATRVAVVPGIYIVKAGDKNVKCVVK